MAYLTINGATVPVDAPTLRVDGESGAKFRRMATGTLSGARFFQRRGLSFSTPWLGTEEARALEAIARGRGEHMALNTSFYAGSGLYPQGTPLATLVMNDTYGADEGAGTKSKWASSSIGIFGANTNRFSVQNVRNGGEDGTTTGFTADGAPTTMQSTDLSAGVGAWQGNDAIELVTAAATTNGLYAEQTGLTPGTTYLGSVYMRAVSGTPTVGIRMWDTDGGFGVETTAVLSATEWRRVEGAELTCGATGIMRFYVRNTASDVISIYADGFSLDDDSEAAMPWANPTHAADDVSYLMSDLRPYDSFTIMGWFRLATGFQADGNDHYLFGVCDDGMNNGAGVYLDGSTTKLRIVSRSGGVATVSAGFSVDDAFPDWAHVAMVVDRRNGTIYIQATRAGATVGTETTTPTMPVHDEDWSMHLGSTPAPGDHWNGQIEDLTFIPAALTVAQIDAMLTAQFSDLPALRVSGDVVDNVGTDFIATGEPSISVTQGNEDGSFDALYRVPFSLREA